MNTGDRYFRETEIRKIDPRDVHVLAEKLDLLGEGNGGKTLMGIIRKVQDQTTLKYKPSDIFHVQKAAESSGGQRLFTEILFEEWGSSGRKRPTVGFLLELLVEAELWQGADHVAEEWLNEPPPARPSVGPAAPIPPNLLEKELTPLRSILFDSSNYPETNEINFNANHLSDSIVMGNNVDRFEKYQRVEKSMNFGHSDLVVNTNEAPKPPPRQRTRRQQLQQQQLLSQQSVNEMIMATPEDGNKVSDDDNAQQPVYQENNDHEQYPSTSEPFDSDCFTLPKFSCLMQNSANTESTNLSGTSSIPHINREQTISMTNSKEITTERSDTKNAAEDVTAGRSTTEIIPNLPLISGLNANTERDINYVAEAGRSNSVTSNSSRNSSFSNQDPNDENLIEMSDLTGNNEEEQEEEEEDGYDNDSPLPNLSNFDQQSSNNDSSLTTVTGTSGSNSFELSTNDSNSGSGSESGNIPCLSAFKQ